MNLPPTDSAVPAPGEERVSMLKRLAAAANFGHRWAKASAGAAVAHVVSAGNALARARDLCEDGDWARWVRKNFDGSLRTAQRYMRVARHWPEIGGDATRLSPRSQTEAVNAIRRVLFDARRSPRAETAAVDTSPVRPPRAAPLLPDSSASAPPSRAAALAVAGLDRLAASLRAATPAGDAAAGYIASRVEGLSADLRLDTVPGTSASALGQMLYFAEACGASRVKIGIAAEPQSRLASLQTACPHELRLLLAVEGTRELEAAVHARLADYHLGGEWFHFGRAVRALIERMRNDSRGPRVHAGDGPSG